MDVLSCTVLYCTVAIHGAQTRTLNLRTQNQFRTREKVAHRGVKPHISMTQGPLPQQWCEILLAEHKLVPYFKLLSRLQAPEPRNLHYILDWPQITP